MTLALAEPASDVGVCRVTVLRQRIEPRPPVDYFYSPGRIKHCLAHTWCDLDLDHPQQPGTCNNDPYRPEQRTRGAEPEPAIYRAADIRSDIDRALKYLSTPRILGGLGQPYRRAIVEALRDIGPREWDENHKMFKARREDWYHTYRYRFGNRDGDILLKMANYGVKRMAYFLGWEPEPEA